MKQVKQIMFEVEETVVLRSGEFKILNFCPICEEGAEMATPWIAATLHGSTEREMFRLVESGEIHSIEKERTLLCLASVRRAFASRPDHVEAILIKPIEIIEKS